MDSSLTVFTEKTESLILNIQPSHETKKKSIRILWILILNKKMCKSVIDRYLSYVLSKIGCLVYQLYFIKAIK